MNTKPRQKAKNNFEKHFFNLMKNPGFEKTMENMRKLGNVKPSSPFRKNLKLK